MTTPNLTHFTALWQLTEISRPKETMTGSIYFVRYQGKEAALKIPHEGVVEERTEAVLNHYAGKGAVKVLEVEGNVTLLERAIPGTVIKELVLSGQDEEVTIILCDVIKHLHSNTSCQGDYNNIESWYQGFDRYHDSGDTKISQQLVKEAKHIYKQLMISTKEYRVLHGDLHHDNVLLDKNRGWLAIDPKGLVGDACYEVGAILRNPIEHPEIYTDSEIINKRIEIFHKRLGFPKERIIGWAFAQSVLSAIWCIEDGTLSYIEGLVRAAEQFQKLGALGK